MQETLHTRRLLLRRLAAEDVEPAISFFASDRSHHVGGPKSEGEAWRAFATFMGHWDIRGYGLFAILPHGQQTAVGIAGAWNPVNWPEPEIGWQIWSPQFEGRGIAFEAAHAARAHAYRTLGWTGCVSYIAHGNDRSTRLAERLGAKLDPTAATPEGKDLLVYRHPPAKELAA